MPKETATALLDVKGRIPMTVVTGAGVARQRGGGLRIAPLDAGGVAVATPKPAKGQGRLPSTPRRIVVKKPTLSPDARIFWVPYPRTSVS